MEFIKKVLFLGITFESGKRYVAFDGDADRIIYFYKDEGRFSKMRVSLRPAIKLSTACII